MGARTKPFLFLIAAAIVMAGLSIFLVVKIIGEKEAQVKKLQAAQTKGSGAVTEFKDVLVAVANIDEGQPLLGQVRSKKVPAELVPDGAVTNLDDVRALVAVAPIFSGDVITRAKARHPVYLRRASDRIPIGKRLITLPIDPIRGTAFMLKNGDLVDVIATITVKAARLGNDGGWEDTQHALYIAQAVRVFEVHNGVVPPISSAAKAPARQPAGKDAATTEDAPEPEATSRLGVGVNVTLEVTPEVAARLHLLDNISKGTAVRFLLRNRKDKEIVSIPSVYNQVTVNEAVPLFGEAPIKVEGPGDLPNFDDLGPAPAPEPEQPAPQANDDLML